MKEKGRHKLEPQVVPCLYVGMCPNHPHRAINAILSSGTNVDSPEVGCASILTISSVSMTNCKHGGMYPVEL